MYHRLTPYSYHFISLLLPRNMHFNILRIQDIPVKEPPTMRIRVRILPQNMRKSILLVRSATLMKPLATSSIPYFSERPFHCTLGEL